MIKITEYFIRRPRVANLILALIVLAGILSALSLRRQADPTIAFDIMKITTEYPGASPEDVEVNVTDPLEDELAEVEDIDEMVSLSMESLSVVFIWIDPDAADNARVKQDIRTAVDRVTGLPRQVTDKPKVDEIRSTSAPVMEIAISGDISEAKLRQYAKDLENDLKGAKGIGLIEKIGYRKREVHIQAQVNKLDDRYVSLAEIMNAIEARNVRTTGGSLESYVTEKKIVTFAEYEEPLEVADVIIRSTFTGERVRIKDVARVIEGFEEHDIIPRAGGRDCIALSIRSQATADIITLSKEVQKILSRFSQGLPDTVTAKIIYDKSDYTRSLLKMVKYNGLIGFALVLAVMLFFLDRTSAFWTAMGLPIAICGALIFFPLFDLTLNMVTLSAMILVLGMLVDDAIVISENIYRYKEKGLGAVEATIEGVQNVFWPVTASVLTTILAFLPMLFMTGLTGKFIVGIPIVVLLMLGFSLLESTSFLPGHVCHATPPKTAPRRTRWVATLAEFYRRRLTWCLANRKKVLGVYLLIFIAVLGASHLWLKLVLFPQNDPDILNIIVETPQGMPLMQTKAKIPEVEAVVEAIVPAEAMQSYTTRIGHHDADAYGGTAGNYDNWALITIYLKPAEERTAVAETIVEQIGQRLKTLDGFQKLYIEPLSDGPPMGKPVTIHYTSDDDALRKAFEEKTTAFLETVDGVYAVESSNIPGKDELRLVLDYDQMARLGLTALDVAKTVRAAFDGEIVTSIRTSGEEIDFRVMLADRKKYREEQVLELEISNKTSKLIPLKNFAHLKETRGPAVLRHYDGRRSVRVTAEVDTNTITSHEVNQLVEAKFMPEAMQHAGFKMELGGEEKKTQESMASFYFALMVALMAIYFLLVVLFDSYLQPILIMSAIPFALIGVFITFMIHGLPLGFIALIGILGLFGVVINASIVMVSTLDEWCERDGMSFAAIAEAAKLRFRPVLLTTITTVAGLLPTAYGIGGDLPFIRPMVLALAWGLVFGTVISLVLIPLLYAMMGRVKA